MKYIASTTLALCLSLTPVSFQQVHAQSQSPNTPAPAASAPADEMLRVEIGPAMQAADAALKAGKWSDALAKLAEAEKVPNTTPYERYMVLRMRAVAQARTDQFAEVMKTLTEVIDHPKLPRTDRRAILQGLADYAFRIKEYPTAVKWARQFYAEGHQHVELGLLYGQALYLTNEFPAAVAELAKYVQAQDADKKPLPENVLKIWAASANKANNTPAYELALKRLVGQYPSDSYWADLLARVEGRTGFPERLLADALRLRRAVNLLTSPGDYEDLAELAMRAGYPAEAQSVVEEGYSKGILGKGASEAAKHQKLRDGAARKALEDKKELAAPDAAIARAKDGEALLKLGYALFTSGQQTKGLQAMEQALTRADTKRPADARLLVGAAQAAMGDKAKAASTFAGIAGDTDAVALAEAWRLHLGRP
jgi:hypothetical protein